MECLEHRVMRRLDRIDQVFVSQGIELPSLPNSPASDEQDQEEELAEEPTHQDAPPETQVTTEVQHPPELLVWNQHSTQPVLKYCEHTAAVKAIAWSPHVHGLLASRGGTTDRCIRFWNITTNSHLSYMELEVR
ncbi:hypothetical protein Ahy_B01g054465 [Arachis hypogaea]|uniref:Anaphase-promoting complex subunit 4 WD40 domain-containing protein n=1 Tax=Arachis hypogaea TaxID=3818 RepID=A0A445AU00_ARAHY|nr:hypothetical protein Ahy_B01g054465 [Arachis hypogaea]